LDNRGITTICKLQKYIDYTSSLTSEITGSTGKIDIPKFQQAYQQTSTNIAKTVNENEHEQKATKIPAPEFFLNTRPTRKKEHAAQ